ncbi:metallopeptidase MepB, partial [Rhizoctonia solani 123E]
MRVDVYNALLNAQRKDEKLTDEEQRLVEKMILDGKHAALALPEDKRTELMKLKKGFSVVCTDFSQNYNWVR